MQAWRRSNYGWLALIGAAVVLVGSIGARYALQHPAAAAPAIDAHTGDPVEDLRRRAEANPTDGESWHALAAAQYDAGHYAEAIPAYARAAGLNPGDAKLWSALGEARVMASARDPMPPAALDDFRRAVALDPKDPRGRYFLAVQRDLGGDHAGAIADWVALLRDTPAGAPWQDDLVRTIEQVGRINHIAVASQIAGVKAVGTAADGVAVADGSGVTDGGAAAPMPAFTGGPMLPGPTPQDLQAASAIPPSQQRQMADGMVARLEARLRETPNSPDGWVMLMRSRMMLNQPDEARQALRRALVADPGDARQLQDQAAVLGIKQ